MLFPNTSRIAVAVDVAVVWIHPKDAVDVALSLVVSVSPPEAIVTPPAVTFIPPEVTVIPCLSTCNEGVEVSAFPVSSIEGRHVVLVAQLSAVPTPAVSFFVMNKNPEMRMKAIPMANIILFTILCRVKHRVNRLLPHNPHRILPLGS